MYTITDDNGTYTLDEALAEFPGCIFLLRLRGDSQVADVALPEEVREVTALREVAALRAAIDVAADSAIHHIGILDRNRAGRRYWLVYAEGPVA